MNKSNPGEYPTCDSGLSAYLVCGEARIKDIDRADHHRWVIGFQMLKGEFWRGM